MKCGEGEDVWVGRGVLVLLLLLVADALRSFAWRRYQF